MTDTTLLSSIKQQIEFYFNDSNFRKDAFLRTAAKEDADGFVPISVLLTFNKLNKLTKDENIIKDAIKSSDIVVINGPKTPKPHLSENIIILLFVLLFSSVFTKILFIPKYFLIWKVKSIRFVLNNLKYILFKNP